jgi:hypothetical protein
MNFFLKTFNNTATHNISDKMDKITISQLADKLKLIITEQDLFLLTLVSEKFNPDLSIQQICEWLKGGENDLCGIPTGREVDFSVCKKIEEFYKIMVENT